ncbi:MAG TPA: hypothetical protein PK899_09380, partial [Spirochaetota bacterium]|nr:hypothetical protein [Spirochaetota bacterium]
LLCEKTFSNWKELGFIKKSKLEEAREKCKELQHYVGIINGDKIYELSRLYEVAIKEILEDVKK